MISRSDNKIGFVSLGCQKNLVDTEVMLGLITDAGYELANDQDADTVIINTCCFIKEAYTESDRTILEFSRKKQEGKLKRLIVTGCLPQRHKKTLTERYPMVDHFLGSSDFPMITKFLEGNAERIEVNYPDFIYSSRNPRIVTGPAHSAYVKIAEGCSERCSFCIIPKLRGKFRSRTIGDILEEVENLAGQGTKEINLLAQNLTAYGSDLKDSSDLKALLKELCKVDELKWVRLIYNYPRDIDDELLKIIASEDKICNYIDLPLQHINDDILKRMRRDTTKKYIEALLSKLKGLIPDAIIRSSFIVGFPGEDQDQFEEMCEFIEKYEFDKIAVFPYSHESGTMACKYEDNISDEEKLRRYDKLTAIKKEVALKRNSGFEGKLLDVMVDFLIREGNEFTVRSRFYGQAPDVDGFVWFRTRRKITPGEFCKVLIEKANEYDLYGTEKR